ncbi:uroporphyrinogen-III C-methyltransferase [Rhizorhapis sp. SPR117]|uniref:uroporphyrinogen-III C-methyltransferase n=1 Tax=Rhizorhapis sp. SPR117 TaxID=2912611 RepID=UPI001EFFADC9|nr:uroporphyrinogen-III C-methyltransferase [Rhizorhapis sp. SPR117]
MVGGRRFIAVSADGVILVYGNDPELLTRKAERLIAAADIVFYDALVGPEILTFIAPHAECVPVGKRSGRHSRDQASINDLLLVAARSGKRVVRLKGGDPSIFGRSMEEIAHLQAGGIDVRICPGITAASAACASLGLSLTLRGMARRLQFVTAHARKGETLDLDWRALADPDATLAVYMGKAAAADVSGQLIAAGLAADTPAIVVENASLPNERHLATRLDLLPLAVRTGIGDGPALLLIGRAMGIRAATNTIQSAKIPVIPDSD